MISASQRNVMAALRAAYADLGIEVKLWDPSQGQVGNRDFSKMYRMAGARMSDYVGCGITTLGAAADSYRITMSLVTTVGAGEGGSKVETQLVARADDMASSKGAISCESTGRLENKLNELALKHLTTGL
jgi:hypothetical protein